MSDKTRDRAQKSVLAFLRGEVDHVQLVRTPEGHEHVLEWDQANQDDAD